MKQTSVRTTTRRSVLVNRDLSVILAQVGASIEPNAGGRPHRPRHPHQPDDSTTREKLCSPGFPSPWSGARALGTGMVRTSRPSCGRPTRTDVPERRPDAGPVPQVASCAEK